MFTIQITDCSFQKTIKENMDEAAFPKKKNSWQINFPLEICSPHAQLFNIQFSVTLLLF